MENGDPRDADRWASKALALDAANAEALALRAQARAQRGEFPGAVQDFAALPPSEFDRKPELYAVRFVCLVEVKDWTGAEAAAPKVPSNLSARDDVARARQKLSAEQQKRGAAAPSAAAASAPRTPAPASKAAPAPASIPAETKAAPASADVAARSREVLAESRKLVLAGQAAIAGRLLADRLKVDPGNRDLRLALLEVDCLIRSYREGAAQIPLVTPFAEGETASMFYAAVALYETGKLDEARGYLERSVTKVSGPLVEEYSTKILGKQ
jgi:hypothetical protein